VSRRLRWTEQAVDQLGAIAEYVSRSSPVYAEQLVQRLVHRLEQVRAFPESGAPVPEAAAHAVRQVLEWPYRIIYRPRSDVIEVLAVVHVRRDRPSTDLP
jgi:plasmid stabilization system protein ParE